MHEVDAPEHCHRVPRSINTPAPYAWSMFSGAAPPPMIVVVGSTGSGKTALAIELALRLGGEVVNADSMALYRGMDIGTAKPPLSERRGVPHHLFDIWDVRHPASVADYQTRAVQAVRNLRADGVAPILVGGSGLYVRAVTDRLDFPGTDPDIRAALYSELDDGGPRMLHERLAAVDPAGASVIEPANGRRIVRALEIFALTGRPQRTQLPSYDSSAEHAVDAVHIGVDAATDVLDRRVAARAQAMFDAGLVAEVKALALHGLRDGVTARRALGYQQALAVLDGELTTADAVAATAAATRRFVRRQRSWFRRDPRIQWIEGADIDAATRAVQSAAGQAAAGLRPTEEWSP